MAYLGEDTPKLGFGLMRLPKLENGDIDIEQTKQMVDLFMEAGGTYFDTARAYGGSEAAIRQALVERYPRDSFTLATKNAAWISAKSAEEARHDFDISLEQTGAGYFDFYLLHNLGGIRTQAFDKFDMWDFVIQLKEEGKVKHIGFSHHDNAEVLDDLLTRHPQMEFVQLQVNYADWENPNTQSRKCVEVAHAHGKPVVIMEPVRGGTLANPPEPVAKILKAADPDKSYAAWALDFALDTPGIITVLSGMSNVEQMQENIATWKAHKPLTDGQRAVLKHAQETLDSLLDNPCTSCHYCMKSCPAKINISDIMQALNRAALYGVEHGTGWFKFAMVTGIGPADCLHCGQCESACPQHIPVMSKLEQAAETFS